MLVNNVGYGKPWMAETVTFEMLDYFLGVNLWPAVMMEKVVLQKMSVRGFGMVVNVSSRASLKPIASGSLYCGAKAYLSYHSAALGTELKNI